MVAPARVLITRSAADLLATLQGRHGPLMFHQSGGCCDGSSPMCYPVGDFIVGDRDVLLAVLDVGADGVPVWISGPQFEAWQHTQLIIDVVVGRGRNWIDPAGRQVDAFTARTARTTRKVPFSSWWAVLRRTTFTPASNSAFRKGRSQR